MSLNTFFNMSQAGPLAHMDAEASRYASYAITALLAAILMYGMREKYPSVPRLNPKNRTELTASRQRAAFFFGSEQLLRQGTQQFRDQPYKVSTPDGDLLMLPPKYVNELKNSAVLDFLAMFAEDSHHYLPGFEPFLSPPEISKIVMKHLTKALLSLTAPISDEATDALRDVFTDDKEWHEITPQSIMLVVSRMSSRIFMGKELCNDAEWLEASSEYIESVFHHRHVVAAWPRPLRRYVHRFLPGGAEVRTRLQRCRNVLQPHVDKRVALRTEALARGEKSPFNDSIEWFIQEIGEDHDHASTQLTLSMAAIHTTQDLLMQTMMDIAKHPELFAPLREEVIQVLGTDGLKKTAFQKLKLMDSCFKETQRLRPILVAFFQRVALDTVKLSDGFVIKKGTRVAMEASSILRSEDNYADPLTYNPQRFMAMRETPGEESRAHLVSVSEKHFAFGHGTHACPGRFFAANEVKIAMAHILLKYEWKLAPGTENLEALVMGTNYMLHPESKLLVRRRKEELDLETLAS